MDIQIEPKPGIMDITPYIPGRSTSSEAPQSPPIKLSSNENPYGPNPKAMDAYKREASKLHRYPEAGCASLCEAIAQAHNLPADHIICGAGSDELIGLLVQAYAGIGDEVLYSEHGFLMYAIYAKAHGATTVTAAETNFTANVDNILKKVTKNTKIVFLANPNNPTGTYLPASELMRLRTGLPERVILCIDDAYAEYMDAPDYSDGRELIAKSHNTVMTRTFSKIYGLGGLRLGWLYGPKDIISVLHRVRSPFNVSSAAQAAGIAAILDKEFVEKQRQLNAEQRDVLAAELKALGLLTVPSQGNFVLAHCAHESHAEYLVSALVKKNIFIRNVRNYGLADMLRISVGTPKENKALLKALHELQVAYQEDL